MYPYTKSWIANHQFQIRWYRFSFLIHSYSLKAKNVVKKNLFCSVNVHFLLSSLHQINSLTFHFSIYRFVTVLVYYGLSLGVSDLGTNLYLTQFLFGLVEIPARSVVLLFLPYSRRLSQSVFLAIGGAACLLMLIVPEGDQHLHCSLPL